MGKAPAKPHTAEELLKPEFAGRHVELIKGEIVEVTPAHEKHSYVVAKLNKLLMKWLFGLPEERQQSIFVVSGEGGFQLSKNPDTVLAPDLAIVEKNDFGSLKEEKPHFIQHAPQIAIEVLSPSNTRAEMLQKCALYLEADAEQVWLVDPESQTIEIQSQQHGVAQLLRPGEEYVGEGFVEGLRFAVGEVFG